METETLEKMKLRVQPKIRFDEFNENWEKPRLSQRMNIFRGASPRPKGDPRYYGGTIPRLMIQDVTRDGKYAYPKIDFLTSAGAKKSRLLPAGSVVLSCSGTKVAIPGMLGVKACIHDGWLGFNNFKNVDENYLYYLFTKLHDRLQGSATTGGVFNNLTTSIVKDLQLGFPQIKEQKKIASFLSAVDKKIEQLTRKKELLETYKKGVMQQLFSQEIRFRDEDGKDFPDWDEKKLGEIADRITLKNTEDKVNFVLTNSATQGIISQNEYFDRDIANQNNLQGYYIVSMDDFVYNPRISVHAPVGPIKRNKLKEGVMSPLYSVFRFKDNENLVFFEYYFETVEWHKYLNTVANFGARHDRMNISLNDFYLMPLPYPCVNERQKIADFLTATDKKIEAVSQKIEKTQSFKKGLLQQMFV